jgi:hypothetical protein
MTRKLLPCLTVAAFVASATAVVNGEGPKTYQTRNLFQAGNPGNELQGAATLVRSSRSLEMRVAASNLNPNAAYTVWWVVFNNPAACIAGCNAANLKNAAARASVFYAAGFVTGDDGTANVTAHVDAGALPMGLEVTPDGTVAGLDRDNGFGAEVHLVVRWHGPVINGMAREQIGAFNGGCPAGGCKNQQAAVFPPMAPPREN